MWTGGKIAVTETEANGGATQVATVTGNSSTSVTVAAWPSGAQPLAGATYVLTNKPLLGQLQTGAVFSVGLDPASIAISAGGAEEQVLYTKGTVRIDGGTGAVPPYHALSWGLDDRTLFLKASGEALVIDCDARTAGVYNGATLVRDVTGYVTPSEVRSAAEGGSQTDHDWLPVPPGAHTLFVYNPGVASYYARMTLWEGYYG